MPVAAKAASNWETGCIPFNKKKHLLWLLSIICLLIAKCTPSANEEVDEPILTEINLTFSDSLVRKIHNLQDQQASDSLIRFFTHRDPTYRFLAANAFASMGTDKWVDTLASLLYDPIPRVQQAAAFSLGQIGAESATSYLIGAFQNSSVDPNNQFNTALLEAVGKCAPSDVLPQVSSVSTYLDSDHHLLLGQARAIYQFMARGITHPSGTNRMIELLTKASLPRSIHILAANYLQRSVIDLSSYSDTLINLWNQHNDPDIRMFLAIALGKSGNAAAIGTLRTAYANQTDYRVRANIIRGLGHLPYNQVRRDIHRALYDQHLQVAVAAADQIIEKGGSAHWKEYMNLSLGSFPWLVKIKLLHATNKFIPPGNTMFRNINEEILRQKIRSPINDYEQAAAIEALAENSSRYREILNHLTSDISYIGKTSCVRSLINIAEKPAFGSLSSDGRDEIISALVGAILSGDAGQVEVASRLFSIEQIDLTQYNQDPVNLIRQGIDKLQLPRDIEAYQALDQAYLGITGQPLPDGNTMYTHPIEWTALDRLTDSSQVILETSRGTIQIQLLPMVAPGTVANFADLVTMNYYAEKYIHRVVPNFVIQGGCNRGDGYGSLDYTIRSELPQVYYDQEGYVGMASAGPHTESAQWFITHCPTPHLDGNYTIFGKVADGMDIVHETEVGDQIISIKIR